MAMAERDERAMIAEANSGADEPERVALPLDPEEALRALLAVDPDAPPADEEERDPDTGA